MAPPPVFGYCERRFINEVRGLLKNDHQLVVAPLIEQRWPESPMALVAAAQNACSRMAQTFASLRSARFYTERVYAHRAL